jgi:hypothetical protein
LFIVDLVMPERGSLAQSWHNFGTNDFDNLQLIDFNMFAYGAGRGVEPPPEVKTRKLLILRIDKNDKIATTDISGHNLGTNGLGVTFSPARLSTIPR